MFKQKLFFFFNSLQKNEEYFITSFEDSPPNDYNYTTLSLFIAKSTTGAKSTFIPL